MKTELKCIWMQAVMTNICFKYCPWSFLEGLDEDLENLEGLDFSHVYFIWETKILIVNCSSHLVTYYQHVNSYDAVYIDSCVKISVLSVKYLIMITSFGLLKWLW
jgi:hypothetical protein